MNRYSGKSLNTSVIPSPYELHFDRSVVSPPGRPKRYLLRLINTSFQTTFIFSIDNHWLQMIGADFVPIEPYYNTTLLIGIGQRYHVIVEADPVSGTSNPLRADGNYWIRTYVADRCGNPGKGDHYEQTGILRYDNTSTSEPTSKPWTDSVSFACSDETYTSLKPKLPWYVGGADNGKNGEQFDVILDRNSKKPYTLATFAMENVSAPAFHPLRINYSDPIFFHLDEFTRKWPDLWVVVPENYTHNDWVRKKALIRSGRAPKSRE